MKYIYVCILNAVVPMLKYALFDWLIIYVNLSYYHDSGLTLCENTDVYHICKFGNDA